MRDVSYLQNINRVKNTRTLFLAWQAPQSRLWYPVGRLDANIARNDFVFQYTCGALKAAEKEGFHSISAFPELKQRYESSELFPLFQNRVIDSHRRGFVEYVHSLDMDAESVDPLDILSITGGERQTDNFEVFPKLEKSLTNAFVCRFFLHGLRHCPETTKERIPLLTPGEKLQVSIELNNPGTDLAVQLATSDYTFLGWSPRYLVKDLVHAASNYTKIDARVIKNNELGTPLNRRVLIELSGTWPSGYEPMSGSDFNVITSSH